MTHPSILIVEDNTDMRNALSTFLMSRGYAVTAVDSTEEGIDCVDEQRFDIGLIDINLPGKSGFEMIEYIRDQEQSMPLIAMTARDGLADKLKGFEAGLTDYLVKPFDLDELHARIRVHVSPAGSDGAISRGAFSINPDGWEFSVAGNPVELTKTEFRMMEILMRNAGTVVSANDLIEYVWGDGDEALNPPVRIHLKNLRRKINDDDFSIIKTLPGIGYKFTVTEKGPSK